MDLSPLGVRAAAGSLRPSDGVVLHHSWTDEGVVVDPASNGAHLLHLSVALCVLNDTYREAARLDVAVEGVAVEVGRGLRRRVTHLHRVVDEIAEIPRAIRAGARVEPFP